MRKIVLSLAYSLILLFIFFCSLTPQAFAQFASDLFTDTGNTALTAHTSTSGHSWTQTTGTDIDIGSNTAEINSADSTALQVAIIDATPPTANYAVQGTVVVGSLTTVNKQAGVIGRKQSGAETYYVWKVQGDANAAERTAKLYIVVAGTPTELCDEGVQLAAATQYVMLLEMRGTEIKTYRDASLKCTVTDGTITLAGNAGIEEQATTSINSVDTFTATDLGAGGRRRTTFIGD